MITINPIKPIKKILIRLHPATVPPIDTPDEIYGKILQIINSLSVDSIKLYNQWCEKMLSRYPPKYNCNKFIYGGISEVLFQKLLENNGHHCEIFGDDHFFDDILVNHSLYMSIKTTKCHSDIIITNHKTKRPTDTESYETLKKRIIVVINFANNKIYYIVDNQIVKSFTDFSKFFISKDSNLSMKKEIFRHVAPELCVPLDVNINVHEDIKTNIYERLALDIIQS
jgi:hypothetical protein